ncbi:hypothetical protein CPB84DRAFT_1081329 [Gymnopilus junonius]|uniref:Uncharacterized protein n=1 Tax=Gymnopilus junonius TaxID=109634 RepID=A0A9P5NYK3_GYMJU|nr:hypothetical protein CPB84DRAFT_1081329 [Gymnopilus junonius]
MAAVCPASYSWARNAQNLDPCELASQLLRVCDPSAGYLPPIQDEAQYLHPTPQTVCSCSSPIYALVSACDDCQGALYPTWKQWTVACPSTITNVSVTLANKYSIPQWAASNMQPSFDPVTARQIASVVTDTISTSASITLSASVTPSNTDPTDLPSSSSPSTESDASSNFTAIVDTTPPAPTSAFTQTMSISDATSSNSLAAWSPDPSSDSTASSQSASQPTGSNGEVSSITSASKKSTNKGAIAGGIIGALVLVAVLGAGVIWWLIRRRRSQMAPSALYKAQYGSRPPTSLSGQPFRERSNWVVASLVHSNSGSNILYHDEESTSNTPPANYAGPRYSHVPQDSISEPLEIP